MKKLIMVLLSGVGMRDDNHGNAIKQASMNNFVDLWKNYPHSLLKASEKSVGLLKGQAGSTEIGCMSIGAGRVIKQKPTLIKELIDNNKLKNNHSYQDMIDYVNNNDKPLHIITMVTDAGIHAHNEILLRMLEHLKEDGVKNVILHLITDGKDTDVYSAYKYIKEVLDKLKELKFGTIGSICGRYYAMDRENNWNRTKLYYDLITKGTGIYTNDIKALLKACYERKLKDESIPPFLITKETSIKDGDAILCLNYRDDTSKQILKALKKKKFEEFPVKDLSNTRLYDFYKMDKDIDDSYMLDEEEITTTFGEYIDNLGLTQARIAEKNKMIYLNYFFDGRRDIKLEYCDKYPVNNKSEEDKLKPEANAVTITKKAISCMEEDYDFILVNYANADTIAHTGNFNNTVKALEAIDVCLGKLVEKAEENFYKMVIIGDHGNADTMLDENNKPQTSHTSAQVPFILLDKKYELANGDLTMVAPTLLKYMDISIPKEMKETEDLFQEEE